MFENLSERLLRTVKNLRGQGRLTEDNIKDALREVRMALLEADVALPVGEFVDDRAPSTRCCSIDAGRCGDQDRP